MVICDTSGLLAFFDRSEPQNPAAMAVMRSIRKPVVVSQFVVAELDHLMRRRSGAETARGVAAELCSGAYELAEFDLGELRRALEIDEIYGDFDIGLTDASLVVLAARYETRDLLTLDERHFRKINPIQGGTFRLLPLDA
jgi:predicted nucleic acid-binding protein